MWDSRKIKDRYEKEQSEETCLGDIKIYYKVIENKLCDTGSQINQQNIELRD